MSSSSGPELQNINNIYSSEGQNKNAWQLFYKDINNDSYINNIMYLLYSNLKQNPKNGLTIDIIDFIVDFGSQNIINLVSKKEFLGSFVNLLKSDANAGRENHKKVIYLTQKWAKKFYGNKNLSIFFDSYNYLKKSGIVFPPENYVINTYDKFVNQNDIINNPNETDNNNNFNNNYNSVNNNNNNLNNNNYNNNNFNNNNNSYNNNQQNNYSNNQGNNYSNNQGNNYNSQNNNYSNQNNNYNNQNEDYSKNPYDDDNQNNNNYNNNNYNQQEIKNPFEDNNTYKNSSPYNNSNPYEDNSSNPYNNNFPFNNNNNNSEINNLIQNWKDKLKELNSYIDNGKYGFHTKQLKDGIKDILNNLPNIDDKIKEYSDRGNEQNQKNL